MILSVFTIDLKLETKDNIFMENVIEIKNLNLFFGEYQALFDINLNLKKGFMHALVGESGCGKTLTAMSIIGLLPKSAKIKSGEVFFNNENLLNYKEKQMRKIRGSKIALIPQDPMTSLNPLFTVGDQIVESIRAHSKVSHHQALRKAKEVMNLVKIPDINNKIKFYPHEFSGGMKQRIIIAMALATNAELIIADEPTTALDVTIQKQIMDLIDEIKQDTKTTILLISHDLALVSNYADFVSVMYAGRIAEEADAKEFFRNPIHPYSNALLNSLPTRNQALKLQTIEGAPPTIQEVLPGCRFHPRCGWCKKEICAAQIPQLEEKCQNHYVSCLIK